MILSATLFLLGVFAYALRELSLFGKLKWIDENKPFSFWGSISYERKYKQPLEPPKDNWYYKFFKIPYLEKWFTSATLTVALTDSHHLMQFFYKILFCAAFYPLTNWWFPVLLWLTWSVTFTLCDKYLTK